MGLAAAAAPSAGRVAGPKVRPFTQICLTQNDGACGAEARDEFGVLGGGTGEGQGTGGSHHLIAGVDVVFDHHRNAVERAADAFFLAFAIEGGGDRLGFGIELDYRVEAGAIFVDFRDPREVFFDELYGGPAGGY